jgi:hypothetical protein
MPQVEERQGVYRKDRSRSAWKGKAASEDWKRKAGQEGEKGWWGGGGQASLDRMRTGRGRHVKK